MRFIMRVLKTHLASRRYISSKGYYCAFLCVFIVSQLNDIWMNYSQLYLSDAFKHLVLSRNKVKLALLSTLFKKTDISVSKVK